MDLSRSRQAIFRNSGPAAIIVRVDHETFLVPPEGYLQTTAHGEVYLAFSGDAPMRAFPITGATMDRIVPDRFFSDATPIG